MIKSDFLSFFYECSTNVSERIYLKKERQWIVISKIMILRVYIYNFVFDD